jgi:hypothetical protein
VERQSPPFSGLKSKPRKELPLTRQQDELLAFCLLRARFFLDLLFNLEDGGDMFLRNVGSDLTTRRYIP